MNESDVILASVILLILLFFAIYFTYILFQSTQIEKVYFQCPISECATNIFNGEKRCPESQSSTIVYDPSYEVCNSKYTCENSLTPYALLKTGDTDNSGKCEDGQICRCLKNPVCGYNNLVLYSLKNGNIQIDSNSSRGTFYQIINTNQGDPSSITYENINTQFCLIKAYHLNRISPGACYFPDNDNVTLLDIENCMKSNPCLTGTLAFSPRNIDTFILNQDTVYTIPVGCFASTFLHCEAGQIAVFDNNKEEVKCLYY